MTGPADNTAGWTTGVVGCVAAAAVVAGAVTAVVVVAAVVVAAGAPVAGVVAAGVVVAGAPVVVVVVLVVELAVELCSADRKTKLPKKIIPPKTRTTLFLYLIFSPS